ncbi:MAG: ATPase, partial [Lactococcus lactis]
SQKETKNSTTIINETVNNNAKGNNILLMTLTSLSASVTIIGGIIAFVRHLRGRGKKKNPVSKAQSSKNGKTPSNSMTAEPSVSSKKTPNEEKVLTETQQINMQADELLKNHKKQQKEYRRRRR